MWLGHDGCPSEASYRPLPGLTTGFELFSLEGPTSPQGRGRLSAKARIQVSSFRALGPQDSSCKEARGQR
jgi:hypothetical protein